MHLYLAEYIKIRYVQASLIFVGVILCFSMRSLMSVAIVAMTSAETSNPDFPELDWDMKTQSYIQSAVLWGCLLAQAPVSFLVHSRGFRRFFVGSLFSSSVLTIITPPLAIYLGWIAVLCTKVIIGICLGCLFPCSVNFIANWSPIVERASFGSFIFNASQIATVIASSVAGVLAASRFGWPSIFYTYGAMGIAWSVVLYMYSADSPSTHPTISNAEKEFIEGNSNDSNKDQTTETLKFPWKSVLTSLPFWTVVFANCCVFWGYNMLLTEMPTFMKSILETDIEKNGAISALPYLVKWLLGFPFSWLSDFALRRGVPVTVVRKVVNTVGMWGPASALLTLCLLRTHDRTTLVALLVLSEGLNAASICGQSINEIDLAPNFSTQLASINSSIGMLFASLAPVACSHIVTDLKNENQWYIIFWISTTVYFLGNLAFLIFGKATVQPWNRPVTSSPGRTLTNDSK